MKVNKKLLWDYEFTEEEMQDEEFLKWYITRVLANGTDEEIREIGLKTIYRYLNVLNLRRQDREFLEWYFSHPRVREHYACLDRIPTDASSRTQ
jgi:hypothetical protein